jgi:hypothetical protein
LDLRPSTQAEGSRAVEVSHRLVRSRPLKEEFLPEVFFENFMSTKKENEERQEIPTVEEIRTQYRFRLPGLPH